MSIGADGCKALLSKNPIALALGSVDPEARRSPPADAVRARESAQNASSIAWTRVAANEIDAAHARRYIEGLLESEDDSDDKNGPFSLSSTATSFDPIALANQFVFALHPDCVVITQRKWQLARRDDDRYWPIEHLLPDGSDDAGGSWEVPCQGSHAEVAVDLMARGFHWNQDFQRFMDQSSGFDGFAAMAPLLEQRELEKATPAAKPKTKPSL